MKVGRRRTAAYGWNARHWGRESSPGSSSVQRRKVLVAIFPARAAGPRAEASLVPHLAKRRITDLLAQHHRWRGHGSSGGRRYGCIDQSTDSSDCTRRWRR